MKRVAIVLFLLAAGNVAAAQRFLVPIHLIDPVDGAYGSRWVSELTILNIGTTAAYIENYGDCGPISGPCFAPIEPGVSETGGRIRNIALGYGVPAALLTIDDQYVDQLALQSRVRDTSRGQQNWGTWIPVVPETAAVRGPVALLDIPVIEGYRQTLRVYSFERGANRAVRVRIYGPVNADPHKPPTHDPLLADVVVPMSFAERAGAMPNYAEIGNLATLPGLTGYEKVWVSIEPVGSFGIWGMVSVTNNTTQEITMIVPHRPR